MGNTRFWLGILSFICFSGLTTLGIFYSIYLKNNPVEKYRDNEKYSLDTVSQLYAFTVIYTIIHFLSALKSLGMTIKICLDVNDEEKKEGSTLLGFIINMGLSIWGLVLYFKFNTNDFKDTFPDFQNVLYIQMIFSFISFGVAFLFLSCFCIMSCCSDKKFTESV